MKKVLFAIAMIAMVAVSCDKNEDVSPESNLKTLTFEGDSWASLIDSSEYYGSQLYSTTDQYSWADSSNTLLSGGVNEGYSYYEPYDIEYMFWNGGVAISNYYLDVVSGTAVDYNNQLSVSNGSAGAAGNNGSANFAVVNVAYTPSYLSFSDNTARTIDHLYISSTSYLESVALDGNDYSAALGATDTFTITAKGYDAAGVETGSTSYELAANGALVSGWNKWSLESLGNVAKVEFSITSSVEASWGGVSLPTYFAIDDIAVVFE